MIKLDDTTRYLFTSDTHWGHDKCFIWQDRGFRDSEEHDRCIADDIRHLTRCDRRNVMFHLGDIAVGVNYEESFRKYGKWAFADFDKVYHIRGNHDSDNKIEFYREVLGDKYVYLGYGEVLAYHKWRFRLSHEPVMISNFTPEGKKFCLCGHIHTNNKFRNLEHSIYHCELDAHDMFPVSLESIINDLNMEKVIKAKTDNEILTFQ